MIIAEVRPFVLKNFNHYLSHPQGPDCFALFRAAPKIVVRFWSVLGIFGLMVKLTQKLQKGGFMIAKDMLAQIQHAPLAERIQFIEIVLQSLKADIKSSISGKHRRKVFKVRKFHLGN